MKRAGISITTCVSLLRRLPLQQEGCEKSSSDSGASLGSEAELISGDRENAQKICCCKIVALVLHEIMFILPMSQICLEHKKPSVQKWQAAGGPTSSVLKSGKAVFLQWVRLFSRS